MRAQQDGEEDKVESVDGALNLIPRIISGHFPEAAHGANDSHFEASDPLYDRTVKWGS